MVDKIEKVSGPSPSAHTRVDTSVSLSEPEAAWVAERQSIINSELAQHAREQKDGSSRDKNDNKSDPPNSEHHDHQRDAANEHSTEDRLSGESERIGTGSLDEDVPFGDHVGFV
ncbi:hypothetical protein [Oryzifoliimicrobium ureilyticus]|uniref:hypothetical protein n=1 Tax=Oryzifoliimicrobium ureilyticus TaxID=3113724 RepID=UPI00307673A2